MSRGEQRIFFFAVASYFTVPGKLHCGVYGYVYCREIISFYGYNDGFVQKNRFVLFGFFRYTLKKLAFFKIDTFAWKLAKAFIIS